MTREEARRILEVTRVLALSADEDRLDLTIDEIDALKVAIEVLKQPEIIRCKDCEECSIFAASVICNSPTLRGYVEPDFYCKYGKRREE